MYFMSCILLRCKWPIGPFAFNKLIDWLSSCAANYPSNTSKSVSRRRQLMDINGAPRDGEVELWQNSAGRRRAPPIGVRVEWSKPICRFVCLRPVKSVRSGHTLTGARVS